MTVLLVPPFNLVLVAIGGLLLMCWRWYRRAGIAIVAISLALLLVLAVPITGQALLVSLEQGLPLEPPKDAPPQAIIVLGAEVEHTLGQPDVTVGPLTLQRLRAAASLYRRTHLPILVSGGTLHEDDPPIAGLMADSLKNDFGVPVQWVETKSFNTWENAGESAAILDPLGLRSVYVVTHAWHEKRALIAFRHFGFRVTAAPVQLDDFSAGWLPETTSWTRSYYGLHEWVGTAVYWLDAYLRPSNKAA
ncbi:MAG TPA: YdcF family protein [Acetobacteraceae bacterium]|nr:YdcF family protein [Acetobacteraceae bacterium]